MSRISRANIRSIYHEGGFYSLGLKTLQPGENVTLDIRDLRERQVPDAQGHTLPPQASRGQVNWSMRGAENHTLIGRSEQIDIAKGISSTYSCMNCCPDSFYAGWVESDWQGFVGDWTLMKAFEQTANCYGYTGPPYDSWPSWNNTLPSVCSTNNGTTTGEGPGESIVQAIWTAYEWGSWEVGHSGECYPRERNIIAEALCEVLARELHFTQVRKADVSASFNWGPFTDEANLNLGAAHDATSVCGGQSFTINIDFSFPPGGNPVRKKRYAK